MIRILRLGNSSDLALDIASGGRAHEIAGRMVAEVSGEEVETVLRPIWPDENLPALVSKWMDEFEPDVVFLRINAVWFNSESIPLRIQRKLPFGGASIGNLAERATKRGWLNQSPIYRRLRKIALSTIGYETHFTTGEVIARMDDCIRRIVAKEGVALIVRGSFGQRDKSGTLPARIAAEHEARRREVSDGIRAICERSHVTYLARAVRDPAYAQPSIRGSDGIHPSDHGHRLDGNDEGAALVAEWQRLHSLQATRPGD